MFQLGPEFSTFSIVARCERTGMLGVGIATRAIAVGARCPYAKAHVGAISSQANTDPRLGIMGIKLLELGYSASKALQELVNSDPHEKKRQIGIVDRDGHSAVHTGFETRDWAGHIVEHNFVAMGNVLLGQHVVEAMADAFRKSSDLPLEERLLRAIEAGRDAGGQHGGQQSSGLLVVEHEVFPRIDLRVDDHGEPIGELRRIYELYKPQTDYFMARPANPYLPPVDEWTKTRIER
ncbi:MAG: DUF1028 domain-containing protein [Candidatus Tectomicrobia bacterium]|nr:DUF1028 domain-containing protein [Candidatus Tectomicrobia bacterium]